MGSVFEKVEATWVFVVGSLKNRPDAPAGKAYKAEPAESQGDHVAVH